MRWTVRPGDGRTVHDVLARAGADGNAVAEGRVFVGPRRVQHERESVSAGDVVTVAVPRTGQAPAARLLARAGDLVAADKPAGIPTIADHAGASHALVAAVARALGVDVSRVHPTSRLDRDVSGVVIFALSRAAAERLVRARAEGTYDRRYVAIAAHAPTPERGEWTAPIGRAKDPRLREVRGRRAVAATTRYAVTACAPDGAALLGIAPLTGRTHQIRVHAADAGAPLLGDRTYGGPPRVTLPTGRVLEPGRIALHCARVVVPRCPGQAGQGQGEPGEMVAIAPQPAELADLWSALGGNADAWEGAVSCALP
jgi:23S rRNA pseudouridine1911/1915/1917 synthase